MPFEWAEYEKLADFARSAAGTVIISVNDHPDMRAVFSGLEMRTVDITYTVGSHGKGADRSELIIGNWRDGWPTLAGMQTGLFE